ncbi:MAG: tetratricopeptide repeat protein [Actinomycetota bacterium]
MIRHRRRRERATSLGIVLVLVFGMAACSDDGEREQAEEILQQGLEAQAAGDLETAVDAYLRVIQLDPQNKFAYYNLGVIEQGRGEPQAAESHYRTTLGLDPDFVPALFNLAILRTEAGFAEEALSLYEHLIEVTPLETASPETVKLAAAAHLNLGFLLIEQGQERRGQKELEEAVRLDPTLEGRIEPETSDEVPVSESPTPGP